MVDLLASGSGIPASASRLAHAMHDVLTVLTKGPTYNLLACKPDEMPVNVWLNGDWDEAVRRERLARPGATTPGLNDKALSKPQKAMKTDSPAKWPTPAEQRVKELENTIRQLRAQRVKDKAVIEELRGFLHEAQDVRKSLQEQAGCRKPDTQACEHEWRIVPYRFSNETYEKCNKCGWVQQ